MPLTGLCRTVQGLAHVKVHDYQLTDLDHRPGSQNADDLVLSATTVQDVTASLNGFSDASKTMGLNVSSGLKPKSNLLVLVLKH